MNNDLRNEQALFLAAYLESLKDEDPVKHEKLCAKHREIMAGLSPDDGRGPTVMGLIKDVLKQADEKRFYQVANSVENADEKA
jgi:hypothetical protein